MWKCDPNDINSCLNCQYTDCILTTAKGIIEKSSDELDRVIDEELPEHKYRQYKYNKSAKGAISRHKYEDKIKIGKNLLFKRQILNYIWNYKYLLDRSPTLAEIRNDFGISTERLLTNLLELQEEQKIAWNKGKILVKENNNGN